MSAIVTNVLPSITNDTGEHLGGLAPPSAIHTLAKYMSLYTWAKAMYYKNYPNAPLPCTDIHCFNKGTGFATVFEKILLSYNLVNSVMTMR